MPTRSLRTPAALFTIASLLAIGAFAFAQTAPTSVPASAPAEPREWTLDIKTGEVAIKKDAPAMTLPAPAARGGRGRGAATAPASTTPAQGR